MGGFVYRADDGYLAVLIPVAGADRKTESVQLSWRAEIKPLVLDEILWSAFMPDPVLGGPRKRLKLRVNGAFTVPGLDIGSGVVQAQSTDDPRATVTAMLDEFDRLSTEFSTGHPDIHRYLTAVQALFIAGRSVMLDPDRAAARARDLLPHGQVEMWAQASHAINGEYPDEIAKRAARFSDEVAASS